MDGWMDGEMRCIIGCGFDDDDDGDGWWRCGL